MSAHIVCIDESKTDVNYIRKGLKKKPHYRIQCFNSAMTSTARSHTTKEGTLTSLIHT